MGEIKATYFLMTDMQLPGELIEIGQSVRLHKVFLYKFFRGSYVTKKKCFDRATMSHSGKETWSFNFSGPYLYDSSMRLVGDRTVLDQNFFQKENQVFLFEGGRFNRKTPPKFYCTNPKQASAFLREERSMACYSSDVLYVVAGSFDWFIHVRASLRDESIDNSDYVYHICARKPINVG